MDLNAANTGCVYVVAATSKNIKMQPAERIYQHTDANTRITAVFNELLERQFPIETPSQQFSMRSPKDFNQETRIVHKPEY